METKSYSVAEEPLMQDVFEHQASVNEQLWQAVIDSAIMDWVRGPAVHKRKAEYFLFEDEEDFPFVCKCAGLNPCSVRESLWAIRAQSAPANHVA